MLRCYVYMNCHFDFGRSFSDLGNGEGRALVTGPILPLGQEHHDMRWVTAVEDLPENSSELTVGEISARIWRKNML